MDVENNSQGAPNAQAVENRLEIISHEFKAPLSVTLSALQLMEKKLRRKYPEEYEAEYAQLLNAATRNVYRTLRLATNFVDAGRFENGCANLLCEECNLTKLFTSMTTWVRTFAEPHHISVRAEYDDGESSMFYADENALERILLNLASNAMRHLPEQGGEIVFALRTLEDGVQLEVRDNGEGISAEDLPHVFEKYWRREKPTKKDITGTGLGLYIVESLVRMHEGTISVDSTLGKGTCFTVYLPRRSGTPGTLESAALPYKTDRQLLVPYIELSDFC